MLAALECDSGDCAHAGHCALVQSTCWRTDRRRDLPPRLGIAESFGAKAHVVFEHICPPTVNDADATALARCAAAAVVGETRVASMRHPTMAGEDFAFMLNAKRGSYILLGAGRGQNGPTLHQPDYDFNDEILPIGASYWATLAEQILAVEATL